MRENEKEKERRRERGVLEKKGRIVKDWFQQDGEGLARRQETDRRIICMVLF